MKKYRLMASFGYVGTDTDYGVYEFEDEDEAFRAAQQCAIDQVEAWAVEVGDDEAD